MRMMTECWILAYRAHSAEKARDTALDDEKYEVRYSGQRRPIGKNICIFIHQKAGSNKEQIWLTAHSTSVVETALCNQPEAFASDLGDDQSRYLCTARLFSQGVDLFALTFYLDRSSPVSHSWRQKTRDTWLPDGEDRIPLRSLVLTQYRNVTDRQTDGRICRSIYSACKRSAVKMITLYSVVYKAPCRLTVSLHSAWFKTTQQKYTFNLMKYRYDSSLVKTVFWTRRHSGK